MKEGKITPRCLAWKDNGSTQWSREIGIVGLKIRNLSLDGKKCLKGLEHNVTLLDFENLSFPNFVFFFSPRGQGMGSPGCWWIILLGESPVMEEIVCGIRAENSSGGTSKLWTSPWSWDTHVFTTSVGFNLIKGYGLEGNSVTDSGKQNPNWARL